MAKEQLKTNKGAIVTEINGLKYFKLQSKYAGDYTKNCGLLGNEIDENFYFLRSNDIADMTIDEDRNLILTRVDGDELVVNIAEELGQPSFRFNKNTGKLIITFPDGKVQILDGFLVEGQDIKVASDASLTGNGTVLNPLSISEVEKTGTYSPAHHFLDLTNGQKMPNGAELGKGFRIVTKEKLDTFGLLYNYYNVYRIREALKECGSLWRVPSREDWADLLNAAEYCDEDRNHDTTCINEWTGKHAGARAKSVNLWKGSDDEEDGYPVGGEDNLPSTGSMGTFRVYPVGLGEGSRGPLTKKTYNHDVEGFKKLASFWSTSELPLNRDCDSTANVYTRTFHYDTRMVLQESSKPSSRLSLRLVKDVDIDHMDINEYENILGYDVPTVLISNPETKYCKVWTSVNIGFKEFGGVTSEEWKWASDSVKGVKEVYFVNEWTGKQWLKKQMVAGDSVVILDYDNDPSTSGDTYHEWRVYEYENGTQELIDTAEALKEEFKEEIEKIAGNITVVCAMTLTLSASTVELSGATVEIKKDVAELSAVTEEIKEDVVELSAATEEIKEDLAELSAATADFKEAIEAISAATIELSAATVEIKEDLEELSAKTFDTIQNVADAVGLDGNVDEGYSVNFNDFGWSDCDLQEALDADHKHVTASTIDEGKEMYPAEDADKDYLVVCVDAVDHGFKKTSPYTYVNGAETVVEAVKNLDKGVAKDVKDLNKLYDDLQKEVDNTQKGAGLNEDGSYTDNGAEYLGGAENMHEALDNLAEKAKDKDINVKAYEFTVNPAEAENANNFETNDGTKIPFTFDFNFGER